MKKVSHLSPCKKPAVAGAFMQITQLPASSSSTLKALLLEGAAGEGVVADVCGFPAAPCAALDD